MASTRDEKTALKAVFSCLNVWGGIAGGLIRAGRLSTLTATTFTTVASVAQQSYHRALEALHSQRLSITYGTHTHEPGGTALPAFVKGQPFDRNAKSRVPTRKKPIDKPEFSGVQWAVVYKGS